VENVALLWTAPGGT